MATTAGEQVVTKPVIMPSAFWPHVGGVEELTRQLAIHEVARGLTPLILTHRWPKDLPAQETYDGLEVARVTFRFPELKHRHLAGWALHGRAARAEVREVLRAHQSNLIHVQCVSTNSLYALHAASSLGLPLVVTMQGELTMDADQGFQRSVVRRHLWRKLLGAASAVTACSQQVLDEAEAELGFSLGTRACVIPNGVDLHEIGSAVPLTRDRPYVFAFGRAVPQKGFDILLKAFALIADANPDLDLVIATDGPELAALRQLTSDLRLDGRVSLPGFFDHGTAMSTLAGARCFVLPSRHEPQGIVILEAMAAGVPVLAARVGGVPETVQPGINGSLFPGDDPDALARALSELLSEPAELTAGKVQAARATADSRSWTSITDQYLEIYSAVLSRAPR